MVGVTPRVQTAADSHGWTESELLERVLGREEPAWTELIRRYRPLIYRCVANVLLRRARYASEADIEEIYAEVLLSLLRDDMRKLRLYDASRGTKLGTWIGLITINAAYDFMRKQQRHTLASEADQASPGEDIRTPLDVLMEKERWAHLNGVLSDFSEKDRTFMQLYYGSELEPEDIAERMAISLKTVYSKKHKIREHIKQRVQRWGEASAIADLAA